ncbi:CARDB domain-containing protein [Thermococcus sp. SY098]|uniref:CARDB domain-containing protein n=1 Tax=Thermococcus sp. SY098 TaxID=3111325 RepID=UPI002D76A322|nr:CARDB domain-containing protein [Thermococcus sp. SY098]WRS51990.1 CARDB domain-containing protein [Thermococcus sp. SY098]
MKKGLSFVIVVLIVLGLVPAVSGLYGTKVLDGSLSDWGTLDYIATANDNGLAGANLNNLYVAWDDEYLYIMITTRNSQSWDLAYGIGIDIDPGTGNGYTGDMDAWGRRIGFGNGYAIDYEIYFWYSGGSGITADNFITWTGGGWDYKALADVGAGFAYTGDTSTGLQTLEVKIPWTALGGKPEKLALIAWIAGGGDSSAVSSVPWDPAMESLDEPYASWFNGDEWGDTDYFTNLAEIQVAPKTIDGNLSDWENYEIVGVSTLDGPDGADLDKLYVSYDDKYLYIALTTNNTASWGIVYGFGLDVKDGGYTGDTDAWGRKIGFSRGIDYEIYFWYDSGNDKIGGGNFITWNGNGWDYQDVGSVVTYAATCGNGLQILEMAIPWSAIGGRTSELAIIAWVAGSFGGDSAVDTVPLDPDVDGSDWTDQDYLSNFAVIEIPIPKPELTVKLSSNVLDIEPWQPANLTVEVQNLGKVDAKNVKVELYDNDELLSSWIVNVSAESSVNLVYTYEYPGSWGTHVFKAVVDPENVIQEVNEENNIATLELEIGKAVKTQSDMINLGKYVWPRLYEKKYPLVEELLKNLTAAKLPIKYRENITNFQMQLNESLSMFNEGREMIGIRNMELRGSLKIFAAYSRLLRIQREVEKFLNAVQGELLANKLTKKIDGNLDDWSPETLVYEDTTGFGQQGANLKALYVDYDDNFLYIALTTENKASWRIAYGFALDYKDGGYTGDTDGWGRKISFTRGVDAELYFWWFGEFFGEKGTDRIETMQLVLWNGTGWQYYNLQDLGFVAWTGSTNGLQTLEVAIPWDALGGKPTKIGIVAWITGANAGDSAVETLPDDPSVHDLDPGQEWTDADTISTFAEVTIG